MKISLLLPNLEGGGAERIVLTLAKGFIQKGHTVDLLVIFNEGPLLKDLPSKIKLVPLTDNNTNLPIIGKLALAMLKLLTYIRSEKPSILISSLIRTNLFAAISVMFSSFRVPLVLRQDSTADNYKSNYLKILMCILYAKASLIIGVSEGVSNDLVKTINLPKQRVKTINNPVDLDRINNLADKSCSHSWIVNKETPVAVAIGRLVEAKGYDTLIKAIWHTNKTTPIRLIILGEGPLRPTLQELTNKLNISDVVDIFGFTGNPYKYLSKADLFVLSSNREGFVGVLLEALALGKKIVATDCHTSPAEILLQGQLGKLVPTNDPTSMGDAMINIIKSDFDPAPLLNHSKIFSIDKITDKYLTEINQLVDNSISKN